MYHNRLSENGRYEQPTDDPLPDGFPGREIVCRSTDHLGDTRYDLAIGNLVIKLIATLDQINGDELTETTRGRAEICLARQVAMYLMHTVFSCPYHRVAAFFSRDRTTISHACRIVEDMRDDKEFDLKLEVMENLLVSARVLIEVERDRDHG